MKRRFMQFSACSAIVATAVAVLAGAPDVSAQTPNPMEVSVTGMAFVDDTGNENCRVVRGPGYASYAADPEAGNVDCDLVAGIQLPDGATMKKLTCSALDQYAANVLQFNLFRVDLASGALEYVFTSAGTSDSGNVQLVSDSTPQPGTSVVDNGQYAYYIAAAFSYEDFTNIGTLMRVYGCTVSVE